MALITEALARLWPRRAAPELQPKASATGALVAWEPLGAPVWTPRDYQAFAREGFMQNAIVYRSVRMIAEAAATIPLLLYEGEAEVGEHPFLELLRRPSADHTQTDFLEAWYGFLLVAGNAYAEAVAVGGRLRELHVLRPDRMKVIPGGDGWPEAYEYTAGGHSVRFAGEAVEGVRPILHVRLFHPANDHYGMSPIEAAAGAIDIHNTAARWNKALLDNSARPSGALVYTARDGQLTGEQYERLKGELEAGFQGARHAGRPLLLEGGLDWKPLSLSPKDMDFVEAKHAAAREIALALGVPPMLLGIPGDNTYSNYQEATRSFWRQTVLPLVNRTTKALSAWLAPAYGGGLELRPDLDQVEALAGEREALWKRLEQANFLTVNEKRAAIGYGPLAGGGGEGEAGRKFNPYHDELGRFTTAEGAVAPGEKPVVLAQAEGSRQYSVDLVDEEALGGHTIRRHVGKSDEELLNILRAAQFDGLFIRAAKEREGSFASREAANDFVNQALRANQETVESVASGAQPEAWLKHRFGAPTGKEAFRADAYAEPYMRTTYSVGVLIRHDPRSKRGYTVRTAYPLNEPPGEK